MSLTEELLEEEGDTRAHEADARVSDEQAPIHFAACGGLRRCAECRQLWATALFMRRYRDAAGGQRVWSDSYEHALRRYLAHAAPARGQSAR